jgi:hypothetical protein
MAHLIRPEVLRSWWQKSMLIHTVAFSDEEFITKPLKLTVGFMGYAF